MYIDIDRFEIYLVMCLTSARVKMDVRYWTMFGKIVDMS